ncbi:MAG: ABC transporter ATP-binding protein [Deltaproteobacteria bacterium]
MFRFFENLVDPFRPYQESDRLPDRLWPFMKGFSQPFKGVFLLTALISVVIAAIEIGLIAYLGRLVDRMATSEAATFWGTNGLELIVVAIFIIVLRPLISVVHVLLINNTIMTNFATLIRWRAHRQVLRQSVGWFENDFAGRIANRVMQAPPSAGEAAFQVFDALTFSVAYFVGAILLLGDSDPRLVWPMLVWFALYGILIRWVLKRVGPASEAASNARSQLTGRIVDSYTNIQSVKLFANDATELDVARSAIADTRTTIIREMRLYTTMDFLLVTLNGLLIVGVGGLAVYYWTQSSATAGAVAAANALTLRLNGMSHWIMSALSSFFRALGVVQEGMHTISQPISLVDSTGAADLNVAKGEIRFDNLSHHYGKGAGGLDHISMTIKAGEKVGLVGRSGAGKTTLVKLLLRFYDHEDGRILIDGQDITQVTQDSLRRQIGMVQQESSLMHRSVRDNVLYGRSGATEAEMINAARQAEAEDFILSLADPEGRTGYDAHVGERGVKLSGGQRQRIALARVILKNAPILVLDEATSALDSEVEAAIQTTLYGMMKGKTVIAIAHRLSTIAQMDRIIVLDDGHIAEDGTHAQLLAKDGIYARLWSRQSGGFLAADDQEAAE